MGVGRSRDSEVTVLPHNLQVVYANVLHSHAHALAHESPVSSLSLLHTHIDRHTHMHARG